MTKYDIIIDSQSNTLKVISIQETTFPNHNGGSKGSILPITRHRLIENNFPQWAQSIMMYLCDKGKDDYLIGEITGLVK